MLPPLHVGVRVDRRWRPLPELVVAALMVSLVMVLFDELVDELAHMSLAKRDHATETLLFDRADEPLGKRTAARSQRETGAPSSRARCRRSSSSSALGSTRRSSIRPWPNKPA